MININIKYNTIPKFFPFALKKEKRKFYPFTKTRV